MNKYRRQITRKQKIRVSNEYSKNLLASPTKSAIEFSKILNDAGTRFIAEHVIFNKETFYIIDFYIPDKKICIELDGGYHLKRSQKRKDRIRDRFLMDNGYYVWRMSNQEATSLTPQEILLRICRLPFIGKKKNLIIKCPKKDQAHAVRPKRLPKQVLLSPERIKDQKLFREQRQGRVINCIM